MVCNYVALTIGIVILIFVFFIVKNEFFRTKENMDINSPDYQVIKTLKNKLRAVHPIVDKVSFNRGDKSYTINKEDIYLCLKDQEGNYYNENMLIYVALHEVAHAICDEVGHTQKFHDIFQELLDKAYHIGIYNPSIPVIQDYCMY